MNLMELIMTQSRTEKNGRGPKRINPLLCAAVSALGAQALCGGYAGATAQPVIDEAFVQEDPFGLGNGPFVNELTWETNTWANPSDITMYFYFGDSSTSLGDGSCTDGAYLVLEQGGGSVPPLTT